MIYRKRIKEEKEENYKKKILEFLVQAVLQLKRKCESEPGERTETKKVKGIGEKGDLREEGGRGEEKCLCVDFGHVVPMHPLARSRSAKHHPLPGIVFAFASFLVLSSCSASRNGTSESHLQQVTTLEQLRTTTTTTIETALQSCHLSSNMKVIIREYDTTRSDTTQEGAIFHPLLKETTITQEQHEQKNTDIRTETALQSTQNTEEVQVSTEEKKSEHSASIGATTEYLKMLCRLSVILFACLLLLVVLRYSWRR